MEWTMEWTDGMDYQPTKIGKTHCRGCGKVVSTVLPLFASTGLLCLASVFQPCTQAHAHNVLRVDDAMFGMDNIIQGFGSADQYQVMCALIGMSLSLPHLIMDQHLDDASYMQPAMSACWWIQFEFALVQTWGMILKGQLPLLASRQRDS